MPDNENPGSNPADDKLTPDEMYDPNRPDHSEEDEAHKRRMEELFGDLDEDELGNKKEDTVESLRLERDEVQAKVTAASERLAKSRTDNAALLKQVEEAKQAIERTEAKIGENKKTAAVEFLKEMIPVVGTLEQGIAAIDKKHREEDPKFDKLAKGVEVTLSQLTGIFNKFGVKLDGSPDPAAAAPEKGAAPASPPASDAPAPADVDAKDETPAEKPEDTVESLRQERDELMIRLSSATDSLSKSQTDSFTLMKRLDEAKKIIERTEAKVEDDKQYACEGILKQMMPVVDTLELGLASIDKKHRAEDPKFDTLARGVETTLGEITAVFNKFGVKQINPLNEPFDAEKHEAVMAQPKEGVDPETVIHVAQKGYELNGRVVRHAKVVVTPAD